MLTVSVVAVSTPPMFNNMVTVTPVMLTVSMVTYLGQTGKSLFGVCPLISVASLVSVWVEGVEDGAQTVR